MDTIKKLNYLFDTKLKLKTFGMFIIITLGSVAELLGISVILPIVNMATNADAMDQNKWCQIIMRITGKTEFHTVMIILLLGTIGIYILKNIYLAWMAYMMNVFSKRTRQHFCMRLMQSYMKQPYKYFLNRNTSEILRSINSDTVNLYTVIANAMQILSQGITAILIIAYLASTNLAMTIVIAVLLGLCAVTILIGIQKKMRSLGEEFQESAGKIILYAKQAFEGIKEVKVTNKEQYFMNAYGDVFERSADIEKIVNLLSYLPKYLIETFCIGGIMGYLAIAIALGQDVTRLVPQLAVFAVGAFKLLPSINALYQNLSNVIYHKASIDLIYHDIKEVADTVTDFSEEELQKGEELSFQDCIELRDVTFAYDNADHNVLNRVSVQIRKGQSVAFVGESGGGKSTLVDIVLGLLTPQQGMVCVDGTSIEHHIRKWHAKVGYIPQMIFLLDDTIRRNIAFGIPEEEISDERVWAVLKEAQLDDFVKSLELQLDAKVGERGTRLSGGQRQRIGIARALYHNPEVLIFDEATSALDTETEREVMEAIDSLHGMKTMIMIAHRLSTIENCDHVYSVGGGNVEFVR